MLPKELIKRINELANKSKKEELTAKEKEEQTELREKYIKMIREQMESQLASVKVVDPDGKDVTPGKLKDLKKDRNKDTK